MMSKGQARRVGGRAPSEAGEVRRVPVRSRRLTEEFGRISCGPEHSLQHNHQLRNGPDFVDFSLQGLYRVAAFAPPCRADGLKDLSTFTLTIRS